MTDTSEIEMKTGNPAGKRAVDGKSGPKIRIAHLINYLAPAGKELGIIKLIRHMDPRQYENTIVVLNEIRESECLRLDGLNIIEMDHPGGNSIRLPLRLSKVFRSNQFDIIHTHSWGTLVEGILGAKIAGSPGIVHGEHGTFPDAFLHRKVQRLFWGMSDRVLSVSGELRDRLSRTTGFPARKIKVILNGVDEQQFYPSEQLRQDFRKLFHFSESDFIIGMVGRLTRVKNQLMMLRAAAELIRQEEPVQVVIVGGFAVGDDVEKELRSFVRDAGIERFVHFLGFRDDINRFYNGFDVFALTSLSEGCSNVIQEAMICGKPVVATRVGGNPELVKDGETGFLVDLDDYQSLARRLRELKNDRPLLHRLGQQARQHARRKFSLSIMVQTYESLYRELYRQKTARRNHKAARPAR